MAAIVGDPEIDPHGHRIPQKYAAGVFRHEVQLGQLPVGTPATISSVSDRNAVSLRELERLGLIPGVTLTVEQRNSTASLSVRRADHGDAIRLSSDLASCILVAADPTP
ncbi:MAG: ferrous iron transport protein A [Acidobacteriota bacterium]|nr:ferrous iron transport protein A [Acidobacteriota bacterium]